jgi:hypothetical protein
MKTDMSQIAIPDSLCVHFPQKQYLEGLSLSSISNAAGYRTQISEPMRNFEAAYLIEVYENLGSQKVSIKKLIDKYKKMAMDSIRPADNRYFIMAEEKELFLMHSRKELKEEYQQAISKYILPLFYIQMRGMKGLNYCSSTLCGLPEDYNILILKSGRNYVLPENDSWKFDWYILPEQMKHGYTSGIAYGEADSALIYWCIAW